MAENHSEAFNLITIPVAEPKEFRIGREDMLIIPGEKNIEVFYVVDDANGVTIENIKYQYGDKGYSVGIFQNQDTKLMIERANVNIIPPRVSEIPSFSDIKKTFVHELVGKKPKMISSEQWDMYHFDLGNTAEIQLGDDNNPIKIKTSISSAGGFTGCIGDNDVQLDSEGMSYVVLGRGRQIESRYIKISDDPSVSRLHLAIVIVRKETGIDLFMRNISKTRNARGLINRAQIKGTN